MAVGSAGDFNYYVMGVDPAADTTAAPSHTHNGTAMGMYTDTTDSGWGTSVRDQELDERRKAEIEEYMRRASEATDLATEEMRRKLHEVAFGPVFIRNGTEAPRQFTQKRVNTLELIKKSVKEIKEAAVSEEARNRVQSKIGRLEKLGVKAQAVVLKAELQLRLRLAKVQEWSYKVLPYDEIKKYEQGQRNWDGNRGYAKVHVDQLDQYTGNKLAEDKDSIIPDFVLDKLAEAKDRQVFDDFGVLWVEKVKDPLLLGVIKGCKDYFLIAEWGEDIKFGDIMKGKEK